VTLHYFTHELPFEYPFTISGGRTKTHQPTLVVVLELGKWWGIGEAPAIGYYNVILESMVADIQKHHRMIEKFAFTEPGRYWHYLHHLIPDNPFLISALDMAAWDLYGKMHQKPLHVLWNTNWENLPVTDYTIGLDTADNMLAKMQQHPWPVYKVKMGTPNDVELLQQLRNHTNARFRVDVNGGWTLEEALHKIPLLQQLGVELVEQPLPKEQLNEMATLFAKSVLPLIADENCVTEYDVVACKRLFHGINIKLTKCSGITPALRMIAEARQLGLKVMMGSMNESSIGTAAIAQFLPQLDYVDMDGPLLLTKDLATGLEINASEVVVKGKYGLGIQPSFF
jgi:L-alanine-DL-glutamate epimerase-like enolase superfamily enzyme